jgi:mannose-1-phosphate guanylyltransferase
MLPADVYAIVLAGGKGTRFWPLSRRTLPKQCLSIDGGPTLLQRTVARTGLPLDRVVVVTGPDMAEVVAGQVPGVELLVEPSGRNTAPAILWAAAEVARRGGRRAVVLPSDHVIGDEPAFRGVLARAFAVAEGGGIVTLGVRPTRPETGFGWIALGEGTDAHGSNPVARFVEKPPRAAAEAMLAGGQHVWNAGMFVFRVDALLAEADQYLPRAGALARAASQTALSEEALLSLWCATEATSIDYGILERASGLRVVPLDVSWSDVGSWPALAEVLDAAEGGVSVAAEVVALRAHGNIVHAEGKTVALLGVEGLVVVDTPDVLLVARAADAQDVRLLVAELERRGRFGVT